MSITESLALAAMPPRTSGRPHAMRPEGQSGRPEAVCYRPPTKAFNSEAVVLEKPGRRKTTSWRHSRRSKNSASQIGRTSWLGPGNIPGFRVGASDAVRRRARRCLGSAPSTGWAVSVRARRGEVDGVSALPTS